MSKLYYVFEDEQTAINAEAYITQLGEAPRVGRNAKTGELQPDKCKTIRWAIPRERLDGKWVFPKVPTQILNQYPESIIDEFNTSFPNIIEEYNDEWFPSTPLI